MVGKEDSGRDRECCACDEDRVVVKEGRNKIPSVFAVIVGIPHCCS